MKERRTRQRYPMQLRVDVRPAGERSQDSYAGETSDISASGFYLSGGPDSLAEGNTVEVDVWLPLGEDGACRGVRGQGRIVRIDRGDQKQIGVAVKFDRIDFSPEELDSFT